MTTKFEQALRAQLQAEIESLVPDSLSRPDFEAIKFDGRATATAASSGTTRSLSRRWKLPAVIAAAVVLVAAASVALTDRPAERSAIDSGDSGTQITASDGTPMPKPIRARATSLLIKWNNRLGANPNLTLPFDVFDDVPAGTPASATGKINGKSLSITFIGADATKNHNCGFDYSASALEASHMVVIFIEADSGIWPSGFNIGCTAVGKEQTVQVTLTSPLQSKVVVDVYNGRIVPIA